MSTVAVQEIFLVPQQFASLQAAVDAAVAPTTIVVAPGVYSEGISVQEKPPLVIQSARLSKRGVTITGGEGLAVVHAVGSQLHLSGICIRSNARSRGILVDGGLINIQECVVAGNRVGPLAREPLGAGLLCRRSRVHLQKSAIVGNTIDVASATNAAGGGLFLEGCDVEIAGTTITSNIVYGSSDARGGGLALVDSKVRIWRSRVTDNALYAERCAGGGICLERSRGCQLGGSVVAGNDCQTGQGGGVFVVGGESDISVHGNSYVRQNHPTDVAFAPPPFTQGA